jgi:CubicO group peptidase (beta-lactamase class C family)
MPETTNRLSTSTTATIDEMITRIQAQCRAPSLVAAVVRGGSVVHVSAAGADPAPHRDLQFRLGSISKTLTAALVLGLRDEGRLDLDDLVTDHLPDLTLPRVRLRHLLGHASGLQREPDGAWWERNAGGSFGNLVAGVSSAKIAFGQYDRFHYSNLAYGLLGGVVERLTGDTWWRAVSSRLLEPLAMTRTTYHPTEPFARGYVVHPWDRTLREEPREDAGAMAPAGQLWSTVDDLARFAAAMTGHHAGVLAPSTVDEMARPVVIGDPDSWTHGYGLGLQLTRSDERVYIGHTGSMPGYLAVLAIHRPTGTAVVAFTNTYTLPGSGIGRLGIQMLDAVLEGEPVRPATWRPAAAAAPAQVEPLLGVWWWMGREFALRWEPGPDDGSLVLAGLAEDSRFTREAPDRWRGHSGDQAGEILTVLRDPDGAVTGLDIATFVFRRAPMAD